MAAAGIPAALTSLYICEGLLLSPLEVLRTKKQLTAVGRQFDKKQSLLKGHLVCFARSFVQSFVTLAIESTYYTGFVGMLVGAAVAHPLDTLRTRLAISDRPAGELIKTRPFDGLMWACIRAVPYHWLSRAATAALAALVGLDEHEAPWFLRTIAFLISSVVLSPLEAFRHLDQAALVTKTASGAEPELGLSNASGLITASADRPLMLWAGAQWAVPEVFSVILLRRFLTDLFFFPLVYLIYGPEVFAGANDLPEAGSQ